MKIHYDKKIYKNESINTCVWRQMSLLIDADCIIFMHLERTFHNTQNFRLIYRLVIDSRFVLKLFISLWNIEKQQYWSVSIFVWKHERWNKHEVGLCSPCMTTIRNFYDDLTNLSFVKWETRKTNSKEKENHHLFQVAFHRGWNANPLLHSRPIDNLNNSFFQAKLLQKGQNGPIGRKDCDNDFLQKKKHLWGSTTVIIR